MSEIWPPTKLGECCDILDNLRVPLNADQRGDIQGDVPYYGANGLQGYIDKFIFDEPLILLAEDGGYFDEYESRPIAYKISGKSWVNNHAHILRAKNDSHFCQDFIFYCLQHKNITPFIKGGTRAKLNQTELREIVIPKAPEPTQRRIAEILSTLDEAIAQTEALIAKHQQIKAGLMHDLFTRGVTPDGHLRPSREQAPDLYKESPLGWIPKGWEVAQLSSLAQFITSGSRGWAEYYNEIGPLFIRIGNLTREHINFRWDSIVRVALPKLTEGQRTAVIPNDILISITADLGIVAVANESLGEAYVNQHIALVRPAPDGLSSRFLGHFLTTTAVQNQFVRLNDSGAKAGLNLPAVGKILVVRPQDDSESIQMASMIDTCDCNIESHKVELAKLHKQKHGLMHDLLTGRVRVMECRSPEHAVLQPLPPTPLPYTQKGY